MQPKVSKQRSLTGRITLLALKLAAIPVVAFILFYAVMTAWWYAGEVVIGRDVVSELVARSASAAGPRRSCIPSVATAT